MTASRTIGGGALWGALAALAALVGCGGDDVGPPVPEIERCAVCHGDRGRDGDALTRALPPHDLHGNVSTAAPGVGAHERHVLGTPFARPVPCAECHLVPQEVSDPGHLDSSAPAEVIFSGVALANQASPLYVDHTCAGTPCHGAKSMDGNSFGGANPTPSWTDVQPTPAACTSCHGLPPPPPHPDPPLVCNGCHKDIDRDNQTFLRPDLHVDGKLTFTLPPG